MISPTYRPVRGQKFVLHRRKTQMFSMTVNQKPGISFEMAIKPSGASATNADLQMNLPQEYDRWQAGKKVNRDLVTHFLPGNVGVQPG